MPRRLRALRLFFRGFRDFFRQGNLASFLNAKIHAASRCVPLPWLPPRGDRTGHLRRPQGTHRIPASPAKNPACGTRGQSHPSFYDHKLRLVRDLSCGDPRVYLEVEVRRLDCRRCAAVKREKLPWLADNPFYTKRFAFYVGRRCRSSTIQDVARELRLDWKTVKALEMEYMREQLRRAGTPGPKVIGIDEISIRKGHTYRIVVSDLVRGRPIWFAGEDRSEASLDEFFAWLGPRKCRKNRPPVMDLLTAFPNPMHKA